MTVPQFGNAYTKYARPWLEGTSNAPKRTSFELPSGASRRQRIVERALRTRNAGNESAARESINLGSSGCKAVQDTCNRGFNVTAGWRGRRRWEEKMGEIRVELEGIAKGSRKRRTRVLQESKRWMEGGGREPAIWRLEKETSAAWQIFLFPPCEMVFNVANFVS